MAAAVSFIMLIMTKSRKGQEGKYERNVDENHDGMNTASLR